LKEVIRLQDRQRLVELELDVAMVPVIKSLGSVRGARRLALGVGPC
jgi:hypothetical protein